MPLYTFAILDCAFNTRQSDGTLSSTCDVGDIVLGTGLDKNEVLRTCKVRSARFANWQRKTLIDAKIFLPQGNSYLLNHSFTHKKVPLIHYTLILVKVKFKLTAAAGGSSGSKGEDAKESEETRKAVLEDRKLFLQVCFNADFNRLRLSES